MCVTSRERLLAALERRPVDRVPVAFGTPAEVAREARVHLEIFASGGGNVFAPMHNIQAQVPPANIAALFAAARDFSVSG